MHASLPKPDIPRAFGSIGCCGHLRTGGRDRVCFGLSLETLGPLVPDAVTHGLSRVVFAAASHLARLVTAECLGGEWQRFGNLFGPDLRVVWMEGGLEPEEAPPGEQ